MTGRPEVFCFGQKVLAKRCEYILSNVTKAYVLIINKYMQVLSGICIKKGKKQCQKALSAVKNETEFQYLNIAFKTAEHVKYIT